MEHLDTFVVLLIIPLVLLIIKEVISWIRQKNLQESENSASQMISAIKTLSKNIESIDNKSDLIGEKVNILYKWHDVHDRDGVKIWYLRGSLEEILQESSKTVQILAKNSELQTRLMEDLVGQIKEMSRDQVLLSKLLERLIDKQ